jgi:hypothetical protein
VPGGNIFPDHLLDLEGSQFLDQPGPENKTDEQRRQDRIDRPEGDVTEDIKKGKDLM